MARIKFGKLEEFKFDNPDVHTCTHTILGVARNEWKNFGGRKREREREKERERKRERESCSQPRPVMTVLLGVDTMPLP